MIINYSDQEIITGKKSIFLAGPTPRKEDVKSWRIDACKFLEENGFDGIVYVPEYSTGKPLTDYDIQEDDSQVMWERKTLLNSTLVVFWIPRDLNNMPAFTTNVEFGYWLHTGKAIYGRPDSAKGNGYLDWLYKLDTGNNPYNNMEDLLLEVIRKTNELGINDKTEILPLEERKILVEKQMN